MATALSSVFYLDLGFSKTEIGVVAKNAGLWPAIIGGLLGGIWMIKLGINRALWIFGAVQLVSIFGFVILAEVGANLWLLAAAIAFEYLGLGWVPQPLWRLLPDKRISVMSLPNLPC